MTATSSAEFDLGGDVRQALGGLDRILARAIRPEYVDKVPTRETIRAVIGEARRQKSGGHPGWRVFLASAAVTAFVGLHGTPFHWANGALTTYMIGAALGILVGGVVADRTRRHERVAMAGLLASAVVVVFAGQVALVPLVLIVVWGFAGALNGMIMPSRDLLVRSITPPGATGRVYAFVSTGLDVGAAMTPVLFGWFMDRGDYRLLFVASASCLVLAAMTALITRRAAAARPISAPGD